MLFVCFSCSSFRLCGERWSRPGLQRGNRHSLFTGQCPSGHSVPWAGTHRPEGASESPCVPSRHGPVGLYATPWAVDHQAALSMGLSRREYWSGLPCPPPGTFLTQGSNPSLLCLLHRQAGSLQLGPLGSGETSPLVSAFFVFKKHIYLYGERERESKSGAKGSTGARLYFPLISATD